MGENCLKQIQLIAGECRSELLRAVARKSEIVSLHCQTPIEKV